MLLHRRKENNIKKIKLKIWVIGATIISVFFSAWTYYSTGDFRLACIKCTVMLAIACCVGKLINMEYDNKEKNIKFRSGGKPSKLDKRSVLKLACYITVVLSEFGGKLELDTMLTYLQSYDLGFLHKDLSRGNMLDFISGHSYQRITKDFFHRNGKMVYIN